LSQGNFSRSLEVQGKKEEVVVLYSRRPQNVKLFSRCSRAVTAKKCTKKRNARAKLLFGQSKPIDFLPFSLTSPSSLLKLSNVCRITPAKIQVSVVIVSKNGCFAEVLLPSSKHLRKNYKYLKMFHFEGSQNRISYLHTMFKKIHVHIEV